MADTRRILVTGGGALGASAALALAQRGHEVRLAERRTLGAGTTGKAAGILSTLCHSDAEYRLLAEPRGLVGELTSLAMAAGRREARGAWRSHPSIVVGGPQEAGTLDAMQDRVERFGEECGRLDARQAARAFPGLRFEPDEQALVAQEDGVLEAGDLMAALRARLESEGVVIAQGQDAWAPVPNAAPTPVPAPFDLHVVAGGAWTKGLLARRGIALPVQMYRTQLASLAFPGGGSLPIVHDLRHHFYTRPESADGMLAGDGTQLRPFDPDDYNEAADPEFIASIAERVVSRFDEGGAAQVRAGWAGLCVATPDRRPLCGPVPGHAGLYIVTGDNGFGLMRSLALGQRLAEAVHGLLDPDLDPARFGPGASDDFVLREGYGTS